MERNIRKAAVLGAGVMGAGIAAHLANAGIPVCLLDVVPRQLTGEEEKRGWSLEHPAVRNRLAQSGRDRLLTEKPAPLYDQADIDLITPGNLEDHLAWLQEADWIIEAVVEDPDVKKQLFKRIEAYRKPGSIISTNTSGLSVNQLCAGCSLDFRRHFLGTHFFNPPRYQKLLEIVPGRETDPDVVSFMMRFGRFALGKGTVRCKDTPNFIANRIGVYALQAAIREMVRLGLGVDEVDALTGPAIGRPKSATFRTVDLVGLDTYLRVAEHTRLASGDPGERDMFEVPAFIRDMVNRGWLGEKGGQGFYRRVQTAAGREILVLDYHTLEYRPQKRAGFASLEAARAAKTPAEKWRALLSGNDKGSEFSWNTLKQTLLFAAAKAPEIADDIHSVDQAMKWGYGWEWGPFEIWDAIGVEKAAARMRQEGETIPPLVEELLAAGNGSFYGRAERGVRTFFTGGTYARMEEKTEEINLAALKEQGRVVRSNAGAALIDIGDGVACLEFTSPHNAIGPDAIRMLLQAAEEVPKHFQGLVIGNQGKHFCVGMNLGMALFEAQDENWFELERMLSQFHKAAEAIKRMHRPVVAAPFGMTLGGGVEVCFMADRVLAAAETYMGLVETGVGLIPGGGGCIEMLFRAMEQVPAGGSVPVDPFPYVVRAFETIALAKVSTSGKDAVKLGYLRPADRIAINASHLLYEAKQLVLAMDREGYVPPKPRKVRVLGETGCANLRQMVYSMRVGGQISRHDELIANKLACVMTGGRVAAGTEVPESYLAELERRAFLELIKTAKTQQRMQHMLLKGKPLRN